MAKVGAAMAENGEGQESRSSFLTQLLPLGFMLIFVGVIVIVASALFSGDSNVSGGAIIYVGPIPVIVGAGTDPFLAVALAAVLTIIGFIVFFWVRRRVLKG